MISRNSLTTSYSGLMPAPAKAVVVASQALITKDEILIVCGDSDPWCLVGLGGRMEVEELVVIEKGFDEHDNKGELADALGTE